MNFILFKYRKFTKKLPADFSVIANTSSAQIEEDLLHTFHNSMSFPEYDTRLDVLVRKHRTEGSDRTRLSDASTSASSESSSSESDSDSSSGSGITRRYPMSLYVPMKHKGRILRLFGGHTLRDFDKLYNMNAYIGGAFSNCFASMIHIMNKYGGDRSQFSSKLKKHPLYADLLNIVQSLVWSTVGKSMWTECPKDS